MQFKYGPGNRGFSYRQEEDAFLLTMMHRHGYGAARRIQLEIRRAWQFRFNWFFKSRSPQEIQKRCDLLIKVVEREMEEFRKEEELEEQKKEELALKEAAEIPKVEESAGTADVANPLVAVGDGVEPMAVEQQPVAAAAVDPAPAAADVIAE
eukprot:g14461.t1 g14461   contig9:1885384-1885910(+)